MLSAANNLPSTSKDSESKGFDTRKSHKRPVNSKAYLLREKRYCSHLTQSKFGKKTLKTLCKLLCKPVSVNITKLTPGTKTCESSLNKIQKENTSMQKMKPTHNKKTKRLLKPRLRSEKDDLHTYLESVSLPKKKLENIAKLDVNQPLIKLHRIDEVINKIAQSLAKVTSTKGREASVHATAQIELNESGLELSASTTDKEKNLQKHDPKNTRSRSSINTFKTNESETEIQTENIEEFKNESNLSVSESSPLNTSKGKVFQNRETENTVSDTQVNEMSQTNECEANVQTECTEETVAELNTSIPKLPLSSAAKNDLQKHATKKKKSQFNKKKVSQPNKSTVRVQTEGIAEIQTEENASVPKLSSLSTSNSDLQNHIIKNTRSSSRLNKVSQTNECETNVETECIKETQTELNASVPKSSPLSIAKKNTQNNVTESTISRSPVDKILQTNECEISVHTESVVAQTELNESVSELSSSAIDKEEDIQNRETRNTGSKRFFQMIETETNLETECIDEIQIELNASAPNLSLLTTSNKDLQNNATENVISKSPLNKILQTNECETSVYTEYIEAQTELNAFVSELVASTTDKDLQNRETKNTRSKSSINKVSQTDEHETDVEPKCMEEIQFELDASVPKSSFLSTGNEDLQSDEIEIIMFISSADKILQTNECEASVQTECIEEAQIDLSACISKSPLLSIGKDDLQSHGAGSITSKLSASKCFQTNECETSVHTECIQEAQTEVNTCVLELLIIDEEEDLQNHETKNTRSRSSIDKISQTNECETNVRTECIEEIEAELNASASESPLLKIGNKDLQNDQTESVTSKSINKISQTNEGETLVLTESTEETKTELSASILKTLLSSTDKIDVQNNGTESITSKSSVNKILQTNECETSVQRECTEEAETELNASISKLPSSTIDKEEEYLQSQETQNATSKSSLNKGETSVQTDCIEEIQTELNAFVEKSPPLSTGKENLPNSGIENIISKSFVTEISQTNEGEASVQTERIGATQIESSASVSKSSLLSIAKKDLPHDRTESTSSQSPINESSQTLGNSIQSSDSSDSGEICKTNKRWRFKRIRKILSESDDNDNNDVHDRGLKVTKKLRIVPSENETGTSTVNAERNVPQTKCTDKNLLDSESSQNVSDESRNRPKSRRSKIRNRTARTRYGSRGVRRSIRKVGRRSRVSSKLNIVRGKKNTVSSNVENIDSTRIAESDLNDEEIIEPIQGSSALDKSLIQKYKLFKELRAVLIRFDSMKRVMKCARIPISPNTYSATKTERLIEAYRNSNLSLERPKLFNYAEPELQERNENHSTGRPKKFVKSTARDLKVILCKTPTKENYIVLNVNQTSSKSLSLPSKKVPSDSNKNIRQGSYLEFQKACHNLSEFFEDKSKKSEQNVTSGSENQRSKKSASTIASMLSCPPQKSTNKTREKSRELTTDARSTTKTDVNTFAATRSSLERKSLTFKIPKKTPVTKQSVPSCTSTHSPIKHKKSVDKKDNRSSLYKCIVCDLCFEDYSELQQHLIVHTQKQSNAVSNLVESISTPPAQPEKAALEVSKTSNTFAKKSVKRALPKSKNPEGSKHRKKKKLCNMVDSNNCTICSQAFVSKADLAAHIFLHTERELQNAFHQMKEKLNKNMDKEKSANTKEGATANENSAKDNAAEAAKKSSKAVKPKENLVLVQKAVETLPIQTSSIILAAQNNMELSGFKGNSSATRRFIPLLPKPVKEKTESSKKSYSICKCHNKAGTNANCLQIEIVLLCHACRVLFRSVNCFESHYLVPEHKNCNRYRLQSGRSPNLFCASCGLLFGSVQDVCHHLETHARFRKDCTMDFRCNICKVVFRGIGSLFYIHWSKHAKDSSWVADESSFPKEAILNSAHNSEQNIITSDVPATDSYTHVGEYICNRCKFPFVTEDDLKQHVQRCDASNSSVQKPVKVKLICSLCNHDFDERSELYNHMKEKHMLVTSTPQYFCLGQTPYKVLFICNLCVKTADNMEDFEDHWLNHNTTNMFFNCMHCNKIYENSLNSFMEHAREHESETCNTVYAIVSYGKSKFMCTRCQIGFSSLQSLNTHLTIHKRKRPEISGRSVQFSNEDKLALALTRVLGLAEPNTSTVTKQPEKSLQMEAQTAERTTEARSIQSTTESDKEKLLRILEENEDDSEHELVIDLKDHMDELNELSTGKGNQEKQQASTSSNFVSDTSSIGQPCTTLRSNVVNTSGAQTVQSSRSVTQSVTTAAKSLSSVAQNVTIPVFLETVISSLLSDKKSPSNVSSYSDPLSSEVTEISQQLIVHDVESMQNTEIQDTVSVMNQGEAANATTLSTSKKQNPPKVGFLRVKTLAELRAPTYQCEFCHAIVANADELKKHVSNHNVLNKDNTVEKEISTKQLAHYTTATDKVWNPRIIYTKLQTPPNSSASSSSSVTPVYNIAASPNQPVVKSRPTTMNNQQPQRLEANVNRNRQSSSASNVTSAYHKNLPATNVIRSTPIPRSAILRRDDTPYKIAPTTTAQNVPKTITPVSTNETQQLTSFITVMDTSNNQFLYKCKFCEFCSKIPSECLRHQLPDTPSSCRGHNATQGIQRVSKVNNLSAASNIVQKDSSYKQYEPVVNRSGIKPGSSAICYRYPYIVASSSANSNQMVSQNQQILSDTSVAGRASSSVYYKNPNHSNGGMSIVINQTTPSVQNLPTIGFLHQTPQQQVYQSQAYSEPLTVVDASFLQESQSQNVSDFSGSSDMYQVANNQHETSNMQETVTTYEFTLPSESFVCRHCLNTFMSEDLLQLHMNTDHNFVCNICNLRMYNFNELNVHKIKHTLI